MAVDNLEMVSGLLTILTSLFPSLLLSVSVSADCLTFASSDVKDRLQPLCVARDKDNFCIAVIKGFDGVNGSLPLYTVDSHISRHNEKLGSVLDK